MAETFIYHGVELQNFYDMYNLTFLNERCVEIPVANEWLKNENESAGLEVGNVTSHYQRSEHTVLDLYEEPAWFQTMAGQTVVNEDLLGPDPMSGATFPWVLSLSTIEHTADPLAAIEALKRLVAPGGRLLVSFPAGVVDPLDGLIAEGLLCFTRACTIVKEPHIPEIKPVWFQTDVPTVRPYGPWAHSVAFCEWEAPN